MHTSVKGAGGRPAGLPRRALAAYTSRDHGFLAARRAVRAAVMVPGAFAVARAVSDNPQVGLFAAFGAFALLLFADFPGEPVVRIRSYAFLLVVGAACIAVGTVCSTHPVAAVIGMGIVAFLVLFTGIVSNQAAAGTLAALLTFVLPVAVAAPPDQIPARLAGWFLAGALAVPAAVLLWPQTFRGELRLRLASSARALATLAEAHAGGHLDTEARNRAERELVALRRLFEATGSRPIGAAESQMALAQLVARLEWVGSNAFLGHGRSAALGLEDATRLQSAVARTLRAGADLLSNAAGLPVHDPTKARQLEEALAETVAARQDLTVGSPEQLDRAAELAAQPAPAPAVPGGSVAAGGSGGSGGSGDQLLAALSPVFRTRMLADATILVAEAVFTAAGLSVPTRSEDDGTARRQPNGPTDRFRATAAATMALLSSHLTLRSVWMRNSLRGAVAMAAAVAVVEITSVNHGFWVILGTMSVLRSNALGTGATALRALAGTAVGFVIGALIMAVVGTDPAALWAILPVAVLVAGIAPATISFAAGQAGFTVVVIVLFNIIQPVGWSVGLTRVEDVLLGCGVSVVAGFLFWPRGAAAALGRALGEAFGLTAGYLLTAMQRSTVLCPAPAMDRQTEEARRRAQEAARRLDDAFRQYNGERATRPVPVATVSRLYSGVLRCRMAAHSLAVLPALVPAEGTSADLPADLVDARAVLMATGTEARDWYARTGDVLAGQGGSLPTVPPVHTAAGRAWRSAFEEARRQGTPVRLRLALRILWAGEMLADLRGLQEETAGAAARAAGGGRRR